MDYLKVALNDLLHLTKFKNKKQFDVKAKKALNELINCCVKNSYELLIAIRKNCIQDAVKNELYSVALDLLNKSELTVEEESKVLAALGEDNLADLVDGFDNRAEHQDDPWLEMMAYSGDVYKDCEIDFNEIIKEAFALQNNNNI